MVKPSSNPSDSGSALILVLLITALLTTIAVSFLSTSRVEQIAAKNFSRQNAASGLAELATQQAMAKIQQGFTVNGTATTVITTQPGAIWQYTFSGGCCTAVSGKNPVELFSTNGTLNANLNNLQNPSSNTNAATNQFTITGNLTEQILVPMGNITSNGTVIGRIAYYVDDEGTKINLNSSTGNRTALNAANLRPFSLDSLSSFSWGTSFNATRFSNIINGVGSSNNTAADPKNWSYFYRPEQLFSLGIGLNASNASPSHFSTATSSAITTANMTHLLTPWGTQRLYINTLSTNATDGTGDASVNTIYSALSNSTLNAIYGGNFSTKYTDIGVKQIAANMLQMRDPNTATVNASFSFTGPLIGAGNPIPALTYDKYGNYQQHGIPSEYMGYAPYPIITEVGVAVMPSGRWWGNYQITRFSFHPTIEVFNPYPYDYDPPVKAQIHFDIHELSIDIDSHLNQKRYTWGRNDAVNNRFPSNDPPWWRFDNTNRGVFTLPKIPAFSKIQYRLEYGGHGFCVWTEGDTTAGFRINGISNATVTFNFVKLCVGTNTCIRDWVTGNETGPLNSNIGAPGNPFPWIVSSNFPWCFQDPGQRVGNLPDSTTQRISFLSKNPINATISDASRNWTTTNSTGRGNSTTTSTGFPSPNWTESTPSWLSSNSANQTVFQPTPAPDSYNSIKASPSISQNSIIPSDPSFNNSVANAVYANPNASNDMRIPELPSFSGNYIYTCPADLGLVPTNQRWRRLRMQMQPASEGSSIPDWAMLDVFSFGNSTNPSNAFNRMLPVNINGKFRLPGNATVAPRTIGIRALAQVLSFSGNSSIQNPFDPTTSPYSLTSNETLRFKGNSTSSGNVTALANNIGNMTWSANSTWGNATTGKRWKIDGQPIGLYILPSEIMEIAGVADADSQTNYSNSTSHFKWNEGRASALIPAVTTRSSHFMIYAYAQAGQLQNKTQPESASNPFVVESEALTKTLVEVEIDTPATATQPAKYKVKKLYTQPIPLGQ